MSQGKKHDPETIRSWTDQLIPILRAGTDLKNACVYLKIPYTTFVDYVKKDPILRTEIEAAKNYIDILAEGTILNSITEGNSNDAKWRLERSQRAKYAQSTQLTGPDNKALEGSVWGSILKEQKEKKSKNEEDITN